MENSVTYIGMDTHKKQHNVAVHYPDDEQIVQFSVKNNARDIQKMVKKIKKQAPATVAFCYEAGVCGFTLKRWIEKAQAQISFQGLPARICWLEYGERAKAALKFNELVREGKLKAPIVIGRDHLDAGSVASPNRETEDMKDGSDAIADWP